MTIIVRCWRSGTEECETHSLARGQAVGSRTGAGLSPRRGGDAREWAQSDPPGVEGT